MWPTDVAVTDVADRCGRPMWPTDVAVTDVTGRCGPPYVTQSEIRLRHIGPTVASEGNPGHVAHGYVRVVVQLKNGAIGAYGSILEAVISQRTCAQG